VMRGATPVFVNVRPDTLTIDPADLEEAITPKTRAIVAVHYAGGACDLDKICEIARRHGAMLVEDAAQALLSSYRGRALGGFGQLGTLSFHDTKNVICGEGGALLVNDEDLVGRAEVLHEKGTNRSRFLRGEIDKYTWVDVGSSYLLGEVSAAFLWAQLEEAEAITLRRLAIWDQYHSALEPLESAGKLRRPRFTPGSQPNGHIYYVLMESQEERDRLLDLLRSRGIQATFHYVPLHSSEGGLRFGRTAGDLSVTEHLAGCIVRLPLWTEMRGSDVERVTDAVAQALD
jgi:dTDP-4-amino-4,6-dideoxygalactose transaminase